MSPSSVSGNSCHGHRENAHDLKPQTRTRGVCVVCSAQGQRALGGLTFKCTRSVPS